MARRRWSAFSFTTMTSHVYITEALRDSFSRVTWQSDQMRFLPKGRSVMGKLRDMSLQMVGMETIFRGPGDSASSCWQTDRQRLQADSLDNADTQMGRALCWCLLNILPPLECFALCLWSSFEKVNFDCSFENIGGSIPVTCWLNHPGTQLDTTLGLAQPLRPQQATIFRKGYSMEVIYSG